MRDPMIGVFVPFHASPRNGKRSARVGWIRDENGCDIWQGGPTHTSKGYGKVWVESAFRVVHRVRYEREVGPIPEGLQLDHYVCNNG